MGSPGVKTLCKLQSVQGKAETIQLSLFIYTNINSILYYENVKRSCTMFFSKHKDDIK